MEQSPPEANNHSDRKDIPPHFIDPEGSLPFSQEPVTGEIYPRPYVIFVIFFYCEELAPRPSLRLTYAV
jgi:hypothetical protein